MSGREMQDESVELVQDERVGYTSIRNSLGKVIKAVPKDIVPIGTQSVGAHLYEELRRLEKRERSERLVVKKKTEVIPEEYPTFGIHSDSKINYDPTMPHVKPKIILPVAPKPYVQPAEEEEDEDTVKPMDYLQDMIFGKMLNILLIFIPLGWLSHILGWSPICIFWFNFLAMVPLASLLGDFTEEVAAHTNQVVGGLINATFGNAVEVVVAIQALLQNEIRVVQASMIGSIFSNLLLVLGGCFFFGGIYHKEQSFNSTAATANMSLLALSSVALILPTPFAEYYEIEDEHVLIMSRIAALFLIFMYLQLLIFQLKTHADLFDDDDDFCKADLPFWVAMGGLVFITLLIAVLSEYLVDSIDGFCSQSGISRTFVGLIILPIVGNAVEHITAISVAIKNKMDLAMGVAVGSCTQISLFVIPVTVIVGWIFDKNMTLNFPHFEIILFVMSIVIVSICISNPKGNWLEGSLLMTTYCMIALGFWFEKVVDF